MIHKLLIVLALLEVGWISCGSVAKNVLMPNVSPKNKDTYLCYGYKLEQDKPFYITEFRPNSTKEVAHHMLLFGCESPGMEEETWNCGEMHSNTDNEQSQYSHGPVCRGQTQSIIYAWAMDAPKLVLPEDVAFKVGGKTNFKYLVLQVHYANVDKFLRGEKDNSGVSLIGQHEPVSHLAAVYLLNTMGGIKRKSTDYFEAACQMRENVELVPFAFRTHAHKLGIVNSGYVIKTDAKTGEQEWTEIGRRSPQLPQMFYPVANNITVRRGDIIAARCTMKNYLNKDVKIGSTGDDEMCNFYVMYYVKGEKTLQTNMCFTQGPPYWYFKDYETIEGDRLQLEKIPEDISEVPEVQLKELAEIQKKGGMHAMHQMPKSEEDMKNMDDGEMMKHEAEKKMNKPAHVESGESLEASGESSEDEYSNYLKDMERKYLLNRLLQKYFDSEN